MDDLEKYIEKRKKNNPEFAINFEAGYKDFKIGLLHNQAEIETGLTHEDKENLSPTEAQ